MKTIATYYNEQGEQVCIKRIDGRCTPNSFRIETQYDRPLLEWYVAYTKLRGKIQKIYRN